MLDAALKELARYVIAPQHRLATAVLWSAYVHLLPRADLGIDVAPRLGIRSKVKGSGKSTLLECVDNLTPNPVIAGSITPSSIFRIIDATRATLLHRRGRQHRQQEQQPRPARHPQQRPPAADGLCHPVCPDG